MRAVRPSFRALAASLLPLILATCTQDTMGPVGRPGLAQIPLDLEAPNTSQFAGLSITSVRATVTKVDLVHDRTDTLLTKTAPFAADQNTLTLSLQLVLTQPEDTVDVTIDYLSGTLVVFTGVQSVIVKQGPAGSNGDVTVPVNYVGPGSSIATLSIQPRDSVVAAGGTLPFRVTAQDSQAANVPSFYVSWTSGSATNPIDANGVLHAGTTRSTFFIHAETPTGIKDSTPVTIVPAPNSLLKVSGDAQSATVSTALPLPLTVEVRGADNLPIKGVPVAFAVVTGGGSVDTATVVTGTNGRAATTVKLGATVGAQSFSATVTGVTAAVFTATATAAGPTTRTWTGAVSTDWFLAGNWSGSTAPGATDTVVVPNTTNKPSIGAQATVAAMTVATGATVTFTTNTFLFVTGGFTLSGAITGTNAGLNVGGPITTLAGSSLNVSTLIVGNTLTVGGTYNVSGSTSFQGVNQQIPSNITYASLMVNGTATLTGRTNATLGTTVMGTGHSLTLGGHTLVTGLLQVGGTQGGGTETSLLVMTNALDSVLATHTTFSGGNESGSLTAGVLVLTGNFSQTSANSANSFAAGTAHRTVFNGTARQTISMATPGAAQAHFNILDLSQATGGVSLLTNAHANQLVALPGAGGTPVLMGTGTALTAPGVNVQRLIIDTIPVIIGGGTITKFDSVTFLHTGPTATALTVNDAGRASPYAFDALSFGTVPTTGFYLRGNDTDGATPNVLTLNLSNPTPGTAGGFSQVVNGALINWPVVIPAQTWNGSVSTAWETAGNWNPAGIPSAATAVTIPAGTPNAPTLSTNLSSGSLTINAGATFNLGTAQLVVNGNAFNDGTITGTGTIFMNAAGQVRGGFPFLLVAAPVTAIGPVTVANNLNISGGDYRTNGFYTVVSGALTTLNGGTLTMQSSADSIQAQNVSFSGASTAGKLTAGVLRVTKDFGQFTVPDAFATSGSFTVRMLSAAGTIRITNPATSGFRNLDVSGATAVSLLTDVPVSGLLISRPPGVPAPTMSASGGKLTAAGVNVTKITFDTLPVIIGGGAITQFDTVTFNHIPVNDTALTVNDPGAAAPYLFTNLIFSVTPTTGLYLRVNDTDGASPNVLTVAMPSATPANPGAFAAATGGALIQWPAGAPLITWTGATSTDWATASNWIPARLPAAADSVVIPNGVTNFPTLATAATVAAMFEDGRLTITGGKLHVTRSANANTGINRIISLTGPTDSVFIGDSVSVPISGAGVAVLGGSTGVGFGGATLTVVLNGTGVQAFRQGTSTQMGPLLIRKPSGSVSFPVGVRADSFDVNSAIPLSGTDLVAETGFNSAGAVTLNTLAVTGSLAVAGAYSVGTTSFAPIAGQPVVNVPVLTYTNLTLAGAVDAVLTGRTVLTGGLSITPGIGGPPIGLTMSGHTMVVGGALNVGGSGILRMTNALDSMIVTGAASFRGTNPASPGNLTAGVLVLGGDFTEFPQFGGVPFQATGTHKTVFSAASPHVITSQMGTAANQSRFQDLTWTGNGTLTIDSAVVLTGRLGTTAAGTVTFLGATLGVPSLQVGSYVSSGSTVFNNLPVSIVQTGVGTGFSLNNVTFQGLPPTATQLTIQHPGLATPIVLTGLTFSVVPTTGFYISATDNNPSDGIGLIVNLLGPNPATPGGLIQQNGGAVIGWPPAAPTFSWIGATSNWLTGSNWSTGSVPGTTDKVVINPATASPVITTAEVVGDLTVNAGATLTLSGTGTLIVNGNLVSNGTVNGADPALLSLGASGTTIAGTFAAPIGFSAPVSAAGAVTVTGANTLTVFAGGAFNLGGHTVTATRFETVGTGTLQMSTALDSLKVTQAAIFDGEAETGLLTGGVLVVGDSFVQKGTVSPASFAASGSHKTVFNGAGGSIDFASAGTSSFQDLDVAPASGTVKLVTNTFVAGNFRRLLATGTFALDTLVLSVQGNATSAGPMTATNGGLALGGAGALLSGNFGGVLVTLSNNRLMNAATTAGILGITAGALDLNSQRLTVNTLLTSGTGTLNMTNASDTIVVTGGATFMGGSTAGTLTAGALKLGGDLLQGPTGSPDAFAPSGTFAVILDGAATQQVHFSNPGSTASHFRDVVIANASLGGVEVDSAYVTGTATFAPALTQAQRVIHGFGPSSRIVLANLNITQTTFDNLVVRTPADGSVTLTKFDSVTFSNTAVSDTALWIISPGTATPFTIRNAIFLVPPTTGLYLRADDSDGPTQPFTVNLVGATPVSGGAFFLTQNGAAINWPAAVNVTWTGGAGTTDWNTPANWSPAQVPTLADSVIVVASTTTPVLTGRITVAALNVSSGTITLNGHTLAVARTFATSGTGTLTMTSGLDSLLVTGNAEFLGGGESGLMSAGVLGLGGDLTQRISATFLPQGTHKTVLTGAVAHHLVSQSAGDVVTFQELDISNATGGVLLDPALNSAGARGHLISHPTGATPTFHGGTAQFFNPSAVDVSRMGVDGLWFEIGGPGLGITQFDSVTFTNQSPTVSQLAIFHPGSATSHVLNHLDFTVTPTTGVYLETTIESGFPPNLTIDVANSTPLNPGTFVLPGSGTTINWPAVASWLGTTSNIWEAGANWSTGTVPTSTDAVLIPAGTPSSPVIAAGDAVKSLVLAPGATLDIGASGALTVLGSIDASGVITGTASSEVTLTGSGTMQGNFDAVRLFAPANYSLAGNMTATRSVLLSTGAVLAVNNHTITAPTFTTAGTVAMTGTLDSIVTTGDQVWGGVDGTGLLTAGVVSVGGNFTQDGTVSPRSYAASAGHTTVLTGAASNTISMQNPDNVAGSHFGHLVVQKTAGAAAIGSTNLAALGMIDVLPGTGQLVSQRIDALGVRSTGTATINPLTLAVSLGDSLIVAGPYNVDTTSIGGGNINPALPYRNLRLGSNATNPGPLTLTDGDLLLVGGQFTLGANVALTRTGATGGNIVINGGGAPTLALNGHTLSAPGDFTMQNQSFLLMTNAADSIDIGGNVLIDGGDEFTKLSAGKFVVRGNFQQLATNSTGSFRAFPGHRTIFAGATDQSVVFASWGASDLGDAIIDKTGGKINFSPGGEADGFTSVISPTLVTSDNQYITNAMKVAAGATVNFPALLLPSGDSLQVLGDLTSFRTHFQSFQGTGGGTIPAQANIHYTDVISDGGFVAPGIVIPGTFTSESGDIVFNGDATIGTNLIASTGTFNPNGHTINVGGDLQTTAAGTLIMANATDAVNVTGNAIFDGGSEASRLVAGVLTITGSFSQLATTSTQSFAANPGHLTRFTSNPVNISFATPGAAASHFGDLAESGFGATFKLGSDVTVTGSLSGGDGFGGVLLGSTCTEVFTVTQFFTSGPLRLDCTRLVVDDQAGLNSFGLNGVSFTNLPTNVTQLTIRHPGLAAGNFLTGQVDFVQLNAGDTGHYVDVVDTDGLSPLLVVDIPQPHVANGPAFETTSGGALVIWE